VCLLPDHIGLSEVTVSELAEARRIVEVASVQNRYSLLDRDHEAAELDATPAQVALAWSARPLAGRAADPRYPARWPTWKENVAPASLELTGEQWRRLDQMKS